MKIKYIEHSGFLIETTRSYYLFDYYRGELPEFDPHKNLVVFVSHKHPDHYNPDIYELLKIVPEALFIIPKGTPVRPFIEKYDHEGIDLEQHILIVRKNETYDRILQDGSILRINTLRSTDTGVAYIIEFEDRKIYHAGDLNLWLWDGESVQFNNNMRTAFFRELDKIRGMQFDIAFVPLDPRLENHTFDGMEAFMKYTLAAKVYPMHMWDDYSVIESFTDKHPEYADIIVRIGHNGQEWSLG